ncbi:aminotransferase class I/II-fold pyridoxal phosphate-dependent enzyme [Salipaludibacillus sp. LMS25]|jgi:pyridoxal phosphate-dependent aminotransferase EpsN|uniref:DegT/DnrJ/EryC1/StrS family aminotransferase n=1 Tax=Salipaludibacillus sp. LMS25 TaxID=2924031 RepID=UPI0020D0F871|nr:aminotransferase class I/II-fold pyridoxal phosphate-dependent enzyme [Salipaludibacillus sp. LMS25]UTR14879.1 aminotransferase class I/II-fold pyridoxal phosphate-dependent enzyme [Salipaludibacillus sp. LMS25]
MSKKIYLSPPDLTGQEKVMVNEAFDTNWVAPVGPHITAFEREVAEYIDVKGAVALSSGTAAIHLALSLLNVGRGDRVFCSTFTFVASANPIIYQGAEPVFIDSEPDSWNMSPQALERAFKEAEAKNKLPKAVVVVHLYGQVAKMREILRICKQYDVPVVEDAAESLGATYFGIHSGSMGDFGIFSFNGNKIITSSGGGMLVSNSEKLLEKARFLATQAKDPALHYQHSVLGYNYRMSNISAGIGRAQLKSLNEKVDARRSVYKNYVDDLTSIEGISFMPEYHGSFSSRWLTVMLLDQTKMTVTPEQLVTSLNEQMIEARVVWKPLHLQPLFKGSSYYPHGNDNHVAENLFENGVCLPSGSNLSPEDQQRVIKHIKECLTHSIGREAMV